jgi:hypothetical protein
MGEKRIKEVDVDNPGKAVMDCFRSLLFIFVDYGNLKFSEKYIYKFTYTFNFVI